MKLSLELIKEHLQNITDPLFFRQKEDSLFFPRPIFYSGQQKLAAGSLYIMEAAQIPSGIRLEPGAGLILIGKPASGVQKKAQYLLEFDEKVSIYKLSNEVNRVFDLFDGWEKELFQIAYQNQFRSMLQKMLEASSVIFQNGLSIMNSTYHIVFQNETNIKYGGYMNPVREEEEFAIPSETISLFKYDKDYQNIVNEQKVFYYEGDALPHRCLCKNIFQNDQFLFRIIITECIRPFRKSDELLLDYLSDHFQKTLSQIPVQKNAAGEELVKLLCESIETGKSNRPAIESALRKRNWTSGDFYRLACIHASFDDIFISSLSYFSSVAMRVFPESFAFEYQNTIVLIMNETKAGAMEQYSDQLGIFVRENNFRTGISNFTDDLYKIQNLYRQAEMALSIGLVERPMEWIHWFPRYTLQYIYNMLTTHSDIGQLYSPIYYRLERYDKENGTSYLETLKVYLESNMNTVQAAKALYIQRSTMIYRLKRIREIADNNLTDQDDILHLNLTFSIIRRESLKSEGTESRFYPSGHHKSVSSHTDIFD